MDTEDTAIETLQPTPRGRNAARGIAREKAEAVRALPRGQYLGRNGEVLTRNVTSGADPHEIPPHLKEAGWDYQWIAQEIYGNKTITRRHSHQMYQAGWRAVLATGRWNGVFGPPEDTGHIVVGDTGLFERPLAMTKDAKAEDLKAAKQLIADRNESLKISGVKKNMPDGFEMSGRYRGTGGDIRMSIDRALDVPAPQHQLAEPGE